MNQQLLKIESYSKAFAEKVCNTFFINKEEINGQEILSLTPIDQVNLFVLKNLFDRWQDEIYKLRSPYFDYEDSDVQEGIQQFMNILSQHILIKKEFFRPILENATYESLLLLLEPEYFLKSELGRDGTLVISDFRSKKKFFKIYKEFWENLSKSNNDSIAITDLQHKIKTEVELNKTVKEEYLIKFTSILPLEIITPALKKPEIPAPVIEPKNEEHTKVVESVENIPVQQKPVDPEPQPINESLNEKFVTSQLTINEMLAQANSKTLADQIAKGKLENIRNAISLNQKFQFINYLFLGQSSDYEAALNEIERCSSFDQALTLLNQNYAARYHWDYNKTEVSDFIALVEQRFA